MSLIPGHPCDVRVRSMREGPRSGVASFNVTSRSITWTRTFSPFLLGPVALPTGEVAQNVENLWQFGKVYPEHLDTRSGTPTRAWFEWRSQGFANSHAQRYPAGKGRKPLFYWLGGEQLSYVEARARVYVPTYRDAVMRAGLLPALAAELANHPRADLVDFDGWDHVAAGMTLAQALADEKRRVGHGHVLWGMLVGDPVVVPGAAQRTRVGHCKRDPFDVYVGRSSRGTVDHEAPFGNPIRVGVQCPLCAEIHQDPGSTVPCYSRYLDLMVARYPAFLSQVLRLRGLVLACHCRPEGGFRGRVSCHAQVIAGRLDGIAPELIP